MELWTQKKSCFLSHFDSLAIADSVGLEAVELFELANGGAVLGSDGGEGLTLAHLMVGGGFSRMARFGHGR